MSNLNTVGKLFLHRVNKSASRNAIGSIKNNSITFISYKNYGLEVEHLALGMRELGIETGDKISIFGNTRKEWHFFDMALLSMGSVVVPIYHTYTPEEAKFIIEHSDSVGMIIENEEQAKKISAIPTKIGQVENLILMEDIKTETHELLSKNYNVSSYIDIINSGKKAKENNPDFFEGAINKVDPEALATIIYTSGTTGLPKGAMITHKAICQMLNNVESFSHDSFLETDRTLTFLPLSHVFGRCDSLLPLVFGWELVFARSIEKLIDDLEIVRPNSNASSTKNL
jgi:long-chain acyl-CoA synthetase